MKRYWVRPNNLITDEQYQRAARDGDMSHMAAVHFENECTPEQQDGAPSERRFTFEVLSPPASIEVGSIKITATDPDGNSISEHWPVTIAPDDQMAKSIAAQIEGVGRGREEGRS